VVKHSRNSLSLASALGIDIRDFVSASVS
jgi:hypothetical protein